MKVENAVEGTEEAGKVAGGVTFEWLKQVSNWPEMTLVRENENADPVPCIITMTNIIQMKF